MTGPGCGPGYDPGSSPGRPRCDWAVVGAGRPDAALMLDYHDGEWGRPVRGRTELFERIALESFQSGLSWLVILRKRENFRRAFDQFDVDTVAAYTDRDVQRLLGDPGIVRNRAKIEATIANARAVAGLAEDLSDLLWSYAPQSAPRYRAMAEVPSQTRESAALARDLKRRGFRFVGPTTAYALMQATGMVDDHLAGCWVTVNRVLHPAGG